jgi:class 3 adenylate cyclase
MSWKQQDSIRRIQEHLNSMGEIEVKKLKREADLEQLLSESVCREIYGAHVYIQIPNFAHLVSTDSMDDDTYKWLIQGTHIYQRELTRLVTGFGGTFIHFQGSKLHTLFYRPIDDTQRLASLAVLFQLVAKDFVKNVFNPAFSYDFALASGTDLGNAIGTMDGINGDRELLFIGSPANHAAKILSSAQRLRLTKNVYDGLPDDLRGLCFKIDEDSYQLRHVCSNDLDELLTAHKLTWKREASAAHIENDKERFPLDRINYSSAEMPIDLDMLSIFNNKRVLAASLFADVSGFTRYVDAATSEEDQQAALRVFHSIRKETARVIKGDFNGLRIQYQGDRIQGLFHLPQNDKAALVKKAVETAAGLQSSMEYTLKACLPEISDLRLAIGIDLGTTLVSKLGARGQRDCICLGEAVENAAQLEERSEGGQVGLSSNVFHQLPDYLQHCFTYSAKVQGYMATCFTAEQVERSERAVRIYGAGAPVFVRAGAAGVTVSSQESTDARKIIPARPYADQA